MAEPQRPIMGTTRMNHLNPPRAGDARPAQRRAAPSPLQVTQISTPTAETFVHDGLGARSPRSPREGNGVAYSPRSPLYSPSIPSDSTRSPRDRMQHFLGKTDHKDTAPITPGSARSSPLTTPREDAYRPSQIRNVSAPLPSASTGTESPLSPSADGLSLAGREGADRAEPRNVLRQSSIDSTMSSASSTTSYSHLSQDPLSPVAGDVAHMISAAGSPEAAVHQLLKEKKQSAAQNAQLWRLVNKQRTLVLGLNKDLERALQDKERYRKKWEDEFAQPAPTLENASESLQSSPPPRSPSPAGSDSPDELPIQRHSVREYVPTVVQRSAPTVERRADPTPSPSASSPSTASLLTLSDGTRTPIVDSPSVMQAPEALQTAQQRPSEQTTHTPTPQSPATPTRPLEIHNKTNAIEQVRSSPVSPETDTSASKASFTARRSITTPRKGPGPSIELTASTPQAESFAVTSPSSRKGPPAPLDLHRRVEVSKTLEASKALGALGPDDHSGSEYEEILEVDEIPAFERGRRKTREADDKERETAILKEQESRSQSKKDKGSKSTSEKLGKPVPPPLHDLPASPAIRSFSPDEGSGPMQRHLSPPTSLAGVLSRSPSNTNSNPTSERSLVSQFPLSPGLPVSPRPIDRPINSPSPRSPREGTNMYLVSPPLSPRTTPPSLHTLSPRAPRYEIPLPPHTPTSLVSPMPQTNSETDKSPAFPPEPQVYSPKRPLPGSVPGSGASFSPRAKVFPDPVGPDGVSRGLISDEFPELLLPPNALPSILVNVTSSRLKPSRFSTSAFKGPEEEPVFTLGISARSNMQQLWRIEKPTISLPHLDYQLKQVCSISAKLPERSLFTGHAPAKIDARRLALEKYFEAILDTPMDEKAALILCQYLSTQVIPVESHDKQGSLSGPESFSAVRLGSDGRIVKEGFLTKRGKNFGGWKARFFVLDEPALRYYESPGGSISGTINLLGAQIGRQSVQHPSHSPSRGGDDPNNQVRHAFLILEPKRKNSNDFIRHVLCAESDTERDQWVEALLQYVSGQPFEPERMRPSMVKHDSGSSKSSVPQLKKRDGVVEVPENEMVDTLQGVNYDDVMPTQAPVRALQSRNMIEPSSPVIGSHNQNLGLPPQAMKTISGPSNGVVIQNAGAWGNKMPDSPKSKDKDIKKRSLWGFREKHSTDGITNHSNDSGTDLSRGPDDKPSNVKAVFGIPLKEAVESCIAPDSDVYLPAVVYRCLEYLEAKGASNEEGIFRLSGSNVVIKALRERFNNEGDINLLTQGQYYDVHAVASLLKLYLRELPTTVLTRELHLDFLQVLELEDKPAKISAYNVLVHKLPLANWSLVRALSAFLISIVNNSIVNKMSVRNVGIVFSPTLNIPAPVISAFLTDFDAIFGAEPDKAVAASIQVIAASPPMTSEDIRSPRRQLFSDVATPSKETFPTHAGLGLTYDDVLQQSHTDAGTGFLPLAPGPGYNPAIRPSSPNAQMWAGAHNPSIRSSSPNTQARNGTVPAVTVPGPEYGAFKRTLGDTSVMRDMKSRRRESSMLLMSMSNPHRKSSMPMLNGGSVLESSSAD